LAITPDYAGAHYNAGICSLAVGDFERGWRDFEWRWRYGMIGKDPFPNEPRWEGERNIGSLMVWAEQGIGDQVLYSAMLDELKSYSEQLVVSLDTRLIPLFERSFCNIQFVPHDESLLARPVQKHVPGLARAVALRPANFNVVASRKGFDRGLLIPEGVVPPAPTVLIVPSGWYQAGRFVEVYNHQKQVAKLVTLLEKGSDFERCTVALV
jgi:hypothetical protein